VSELRLDDFADERVFFDELVMQLRSAGGAGSYNGVQARARDPAFPQ